MNLKVILFIIFVIVVLSIAGYFLFNILNKSSDNLQNQGGQQGVQGGQFGGIGGGESVDNTKIQEITNKIKYPSSNNDSTDNISYDLKHLPSDSSLNNLMNSLGQEVNNF